MNKWERKIRHMIIQESDQSYEPRSSHSPEEVALTIFNNIFSDTPAYAYDMDAAGIYSKELRILADIRRNGLTAAENSLNSLKSFPRSALTDLLKNQGEAHKDTDERLIIGKKGKQVFRTLSMGDIRKLPRAQWQVPGVFQKVSVSMTYGDANTGKTFVDLDIALHLAYGMMWQNRKLERTRVLYIYGEGNEGLANRLDAWLKKYEQEDTDYIQFICFPVQLMSELETLCATIEDQEEIPGLIVIDTFSVCAEGIPENDNVEVAKFIACASYIKRNHKTHVHIIHHAGKNGDYRGAAAFKGNIDTMVLLSREDNEAPIIMTCKKQKDASYFPDIRLQLEQVVLGFDEETLETISSCVVTSTDVLTFNEEKANQERQKMLDILSEPGKMSVKVWRDASAKENVSRNAFYAHKDYLVQTGRILEEKQGPGKPVYYSVAKDER